jgi:hypothetical protein
MLNYQRVYPQKSPKNIATDVKVPRGEFLHQVVPFGLAHLVLGNPWLSQGISTFFWGINISI